MSLTDPGWLADKPTLYLAISYESVWRFWRGVSGPPQSVAIEASGQIWAINNNAELTMMMPSAPCSLCRSAREWLLPLISSSPYRVLCYQLFSDGHSTHFRNTTSRASVSLTTLQTSAIVAWGYWPPHCPYCLAPRKIRNTEKPALIQYKAPSAAFHRQNPWK